MFDVGAGTPAANSLGDGTVANRSTPPSTDVLSGVRAISAGDAHTCALMLTGGIRCWGHNWDGQLGYAAIDHSRPTLVVGICD